MCSWKNSICGLLLLVMGSASGLANEIDATTAHLLAQNGKLTIIDIRRPAEWRETGMPDTSVGISLQNFLKKIRFMFLIIRNAMHIMRFHLIEKRMKKN